MKILINKFPKTAKIIAYSFHTYLTTNGEPTKVVLDEPKGINELIEDDKSIFYGAKLGKNGLELQQNDTFKFGANLKESEELMSMFSVETEDGKIYTDDESINLYKDNKKEKK